MVKGLGLRTKCDQVKEEMKTIQQGVLAFGKEKEVAWKIDIKSCFVYIVFVLPSIIKIGAKNILNKSFGLLIWLCLVGSKFVSVLFLRSRTIFVECDESL